jgi:hypothetical protein
MILLARTSNDGPSKYAGLSLPCANMKIPGVETRRLKKRRANMLCFFTDAQFGFGPSRRKPGLDGRDEDAGI